MCTYIYNITQKLDVVAHVYIRIYTYTPPKRGVMAHISQLQQRIKTNSDSELYICALDCETIGTYVYTHKTYVHVNTHTYTTCLQSQASWHIFQSCSNESKKKSDSRSSKILLHMYMHTKSFTCLHIQHTCTYCYICTYTQNASHSHT